MAKKPTVEELLEKIESLENDLAFERKINREFLGLPDDAGKDEIQAAIPWTNEWMQDQMDDHEVTDGAVTKAYGQLVYKLLRLKNGNVIIRSHNGKRAKKELWRYKKLKFILTQESFFMMLELMKFAEREFDLNQKAVVDKLTGGEGIKVRRSINGF